MYVYICTTKSLGVHIDQNLNWEFHIKEISRKIASGISAMKRIRNFVPHESEILLTIYNSLIQPHIKSDFFKHRTEKTNYKIQRFGVVITPFSRKNISDNANYSI